MKARQRDTQKPFKRNGLRPYSDCDLVLLFLGPVPGVPVTPFEGSHRPHSGITRIEFTVPGQPQPQGSKTVGKTKTGRPFMRDDNPKTKAWRDSVTAAALDAMTLHRDDDTTGNLQLLHGPLRLHAVFVFHRPAGHFGTGRNYGKLKPTAPLYVRTRPDVDKLLRAVGDALTGVVFRDDAQLVEVRAEKHYGAPPCAHLVVEELTLEDDRPL